jgi:transcriptional regulator with XRE-family HTH domain
VPKDKARKALLAQGKKIQTARQAKGWTRTHLAKRAKVTIATIRGCETGRSVTQIEKLKAIVEALGHSVKWLEADESGDPRVRNWWDEDYVIGAWYHNAPRPLKNRIWALQEIPMAAAAILDPQFLALLETWPTLTTAQKNFILNSLEYTRLHPPPDSLSIATDSEKLSDGSTPPHRLHPPSRGSKR